jgi:hypothetical protein
LGLKWVIGGVSGVGFGISEIGFHVSKLGFPKSEVGFANSGMDSWAHRGRLAGMPGWKVADGSGPGWAVEVL